MCRDLLLLLVVLAVARTVGAMPPPMSDEELHERSDIVATVHVLGVVCTGVKDVAPPKRAEKSEPARLGSYQAWVRVKEVEKGNVHCNQTLVIAWHERSPFLLGGRAVPYFPGEIVHTYLRWDAKKRSYRATHWNAKGEPEKKRSRGLPPKKPGAMALVAQTTDESVPEQ